MERKLWCVTNEHGARSVVPSFAKEAKLGQPISWYGWKKRSRASPLHPSQSGAQRAGVESGAVGMEQFPSLSFGSRRDSGN